MSKQIQHILFYLLILCMMFPLNSFAQRDDLGKALENLERNIEKVRELAQSFNNRQALDLVNTANKLFTEARSLAVEAKRSAAFARIKAANALLEQATKITLDGPVRRLRSRLEQLLQKSQTDLSPKLNREADRILREARRNQDAAERALAAGRVKVAVEHFRHAITLVERALAIMKNPAIATLDAIEQDKHRYEGLLEKAREKVERSGNPQAKRILEQALKLAASAERAFQGHDFELARKLLNQSVLLLLRAMDVAAGSSDIAVRQAEISLARLREKIHSARDLIAGSGKPRARVLLDRARRFAREAEIGMQEGRSHEARWKIGLAETMVKRAERVARNGDRRQFTNKLAEEIDKTQSEIAVLAAQLTPRSPKDARTLIEMSRRAVAQAEKAEAAGFSRLALEAVLASQRFLTKADKILSSLEHADVTRQAIDVRLRQLDAAIADAESRLTGTEQAWNRQLLRSAKDIRNMAVDSFERGNYRAADEGIQVAFEFVRKSQKNLPR